MLHRCATQALCLALAARIQPVLVAAAGTPLALLDVDPDPAPRLLFDELVSKRDRTESARSSSTELSRRRVEEEGPGEVSAFCLALGLREAGAAVLCRPTELLPESTPFFAFSSTAASTGTSAWWASDPSGSAGGWPGCRLRNGPCGERLCRFCGEVACRKRADMVAPPSAHGQSRSPVEAARCVRSECGGTPPPALAPSERWEAIRVGAAALSAACAFGQFGVCPADAGQPPRAETGVLPEAAWMDEAAEGSESGEESSA
mmetsp:Transcript_81765/g.243852  ORF Transcript_81765/g.243852 Transcript_81765/m.243852 type:complete len:261 (-) Transcript_81765:444-1226(-)